MKSGLGIRPELFGSIENSSTEFGFFEAHSENYFGESIGRAKLLDLRQDHPVSLHGVGLSLGRADDLDQHHLSQLKDLVDQVEPLLVSEHLAWSAYSHRHLPDLLPLPLSNDALDIICQHVDQMQAALGRQILIENPSNYLIFDQLQIPEAEFLNTVAQRTGCGLLMDINNIHVSAINTGRDSKGYIDAVNSDFIAQYHLAGYTEVTREYSGKSETVLIDTHNQPIYPPVWTLFEHTLNTHGVRPTLFEWDSDFPEFKVIEDECNKANVLIDRFVDESNATTQLARAAEIVKFKGLNEGNESSNSLVEAQQGFLDVLLNLEPSLNVAQEQHRGRISIYQNNVFGAIQDYLSDIFPATKGVLGDAFFKQTAELYLQQHPPSEGNIYEYGLGFSEFCSAVEELESLVYLNDLIAYEWHLHQAYFSKVSDALEPASLPQEELLVSNVDLNDSVALIESSYPIYEIHRQSLPTFEGTVAIDLNQSHDSILVCKVGNGVDSVVITSEQMLVIKSVIKNKNLLQAIEHVQGSIEADVLSSTLSLMFEMQLLKESPIET